MENKKMESSRGNDLRVKKTHKALCTAIFKLLERRKFNNISVQDLCTEALVSRATFYTHFRDKYDLLEYMLSEVRESTAKDICNYDELEQKVNQFIYSNKKIISNILKDANEETLSIVRGFVSSIVELILKRPIKKDTNPQHIILLEFFTGGLVNLLTWISVNNYPPEIPMMNTYLYKMLEVITDWDAEQGKAETVHKFTSQAKRKGKLSNEYRKLKKCGRTTAGS